MHPRGGPTWGEARPPRPVPTLSCCLSHGRCLPGVPRLAGVSAAVGVSVCPATARCRPSE